ncbi:MAG: Uncharacterized protein G01um101448_56 [Parcubacteria group bacterium Gr01-1014_48]|nr:MAG: Uncharacterized protein Greene041614_138 [Parcubacteria group bacterium Greene0416_14]TSC74537.1 MAG: Uncharacterized protein G01um101448_56 [Parcubacteria group bacterium Gr01-1014_48]TSD01413.1 MAG: Uncharacterized protein Greene101415_260 [Parcubacteria group bacterium Greene1014_15]TSD08445.1 MAG: Uncharacterized protein Greene07144_75 [Parcubacteria group bacterium Greene0714_4]
MLRRPTTVRSAKRKQDKRKKIIFYSFAIAFGSVVIAIGISYILRSPGLAIESVRVTGDTVVPAANVVALVESILDTKFLFIFPRKNVLVYPKEMIEYTVVREFDRVLSAAVALGSDNVLMVRIVDRKPFATWCGNVQVVAATDCYFVDEQGTIFASAPYFSGTAFIKYYGVVGTEDPVGRALLDPESFIALGRFILSLRDLGLEPQDVVLGPTGHEVYFHNGGKIIFNAHDSYPELFNNLASVLTPIFKDTASSSRKFKYIDLRFDNRVFYKE